jgi:hypothetical protein
MHKIRSKPQLFTACPLHIDFNDVCGLLHEDNQILAGAPAELWIGDAENILLVDITLKSICA